MGQCEPVELPECSWAKRIWSTVPVALLVIGTLGNLLNIVILSRREMRKSSTSVYLLCLAVSDLTFLWLGMAPRMLLYGYNVDLKVKSVFLCKLVSWLQSSAAGFSMWTVVLLTLERVFLTKFPITAKRRITRKKTIAVVTIVLLINLSLTSHVLFAFGLVSVPQENSSVTHTVTVCTVASSSLVPFYKSIWPLLLLVVQNSVSFMLIFLGNITIAITIIAQRQKLRKINTLTYDALQFAPSRVKSATKMLFLVSTMLFISTVPFTTGNVILTQQNARNAQDEAQKQFIYSILRCILYCNFTFNFVLYFVSGTLFKQEWKALVADIQLRLNRLFPRRNRVIQPQTTTSAGSSYPARNPDTQDTQQKPKGANTTLY